MTQILAIEERDILQQVKLSIKIPEIIEQIIIRKVITEAATETGIKVTSDELQQAADEFRSSNQLHDAQETWEWLSKQGLSLDDFEEVLHYSLISLKLSKHLFQDKIEPYFVENRLDYTGVVMYEVLLEDEDLAMELYLAIQDQEIGFHEVAHQYISNLELRRKGGYRGILYRKDLKPEISAAVFATNPPELLKPILTSHGVYLILVEELIKPELTEELALKIKISLFDSWLKQKVKAVEYELVNDLS
ncbi:MAG: peptidylprolyl isomerase [Hydrococcus sp. Prado102]|jgi:parvulin-like peptidyl-prolyl isomerase|nr:peptidylprolyl isomerase [Hydrococcus sp. Prado102]